MMWSFLCLFFLILFVIYFLASSNLFAQWRFLQRPSLIGPCGGSAAWLQQVIWAGMHSAPPQPLAFQEQPSMSNQAAFPLPSSAATWKKTCLRLIRGGGRREGLFFKMSRLFPRTKRNNSSSNTGLSQLRFGIRSALFPHCDGCRRTQSALSVG